MVAACEASGTQLTFNHQRRFDPPYIKTRQMIRDGVIGKLRTIEMPTNNLFDWGTHWFDMMFFYNEQVPAESVLGQAEPTGGSTVFGVQLEGQGISWVRFANGVQGIMPTAKDHGWGVQNRIIGSEGMIEIGATGWDSLRYWNGAQAGWVEVETKGGEGDPFALAIADIVASLREGREPELSARKALMATELIFATYASARRGGRVDLPLMAEDVEVYAVAREA
jgi:predicted dehydrogenase